MSPVQEETPRQLLRTPALFEAGVLGRAHVRYPEGCTDDTDCRRSERRTLAHHTGVPEDRIAQVQQVHGTDILCVTAEHLRAPAPIFLAEADALFTEEPEAVLCIRTADCVPIFVWSQGVRPFAGVIHAGWRGLAAGIIHKFFRKIALAFPSAEGKVEAHVGPAISAAAYEVGAETARHFSRVHDRDGRLFVDLAGEAVSTLSEYSSSVSASATCTFQDNTLYYSHRKGDQGRNLSFIRFRAGRPARAGVHSV